MLKLLSLLWQLSQVDGKLHRIDKRKAGKMYKLNQAVRVQEYEVTVMAVEDLYVPPFRLNLGTQPHRPTGLAENGQPPRTDLQRVLFIDVLYRNPTPDKSLDCRYNQWYLYDTDGYSYEATEENRFLYNNNGKQFLGGSRYISPGMKARGWLAFELKDTTIPERIQFLDGFLGGHTADFMLESSDPTP